MMLSTSSLVVNFTTVFLERKSVSAGRVVRAKERNAECVYIICIYIYICLTGLVLLEAASQRLSAAPQA